MKSVLYLGCPPADRADTETQLAAESVSVIWADNVAYALNELQRVDMPVLVDLSRGAGALQVARELRNHRAATLMFAVVDPRRPDLTTEAVLAGVADVFARPIGGKRVANAIARELAYESRPTGATEVPHSGELYTQSPAMREVLNLISKAATTRTGVLVRGEEGTGRRAVSQAIHTLQPLSLGPFVCVDCAAHGTEKLDQELFGTSSRPHRPERRDFERITRTSWLYAAHGGTLYLQNLVEAPMRVQARLARVLRDREAVCAATGETLSIDVRPMAGVDPGFDRAVEEGRVRDDLFRRLSVMRIDMPPLRSRREDIPALANYFLRMICASRRVPPKTLSRPALSLLGALPWRGNAVELRTLLESIVGGLAGGRGIGLDDVLAHVKLDGGAGMFANGDTLRQARTRFEREYIVATLDQHRGRISDAAKALGIQRTNLYRKLRALRVNKGQ